MSNEEKILAMLTALTGKVDAMDGRLDRLETDVSELKETVKELDERSRRSAVLLEGEIAPQVRALFEGHKNLLDTLAPKERVEKVEEVIEERVVVLEAVVKSHSQKIAKLEKAQ